MKKSYLLTILLGIGLGLSGCGSSSVDGFQESDDAATVEKIVISIGCTTPITLSEYIELKSGDKIVKDEEDSTVKLYHDENNLKRVCIETGEAHIERAITE